MHDDPIGYFLTWTCYGTWLPGDERGWTRWRKGMAVAQPLLAQWCQARMVEEPVVLDERQRLLVHDAIERHCRVRSWSLHAVNCRSNHCHVVVTARDYEGEQVRDQFKAWCTRGLKDDERPRVAPGSEVRKNWWTRKGSVRYVFDEESLEAAIEYTKEAQETGGSKKR